MKVKKNQFYLTENDEKNLCWKKYVTKYKKICCKFLSKFISQKENLISHIHIYEENDEKKEMLKEWQTALEITCKSFGIAV